MKGGVNSQIFKMMICIVSFFPLSGCENQIVKKTVNTKKAIDSQVPFQTLLAEANDFDLVDGTFVKIGARYGHWVDAAKYTPEERVIMLVWHASGFIDNGGFEYLFSGEFDGDPDFRITAQAHKEAGLTRSYEAFQEAFALFPDGKVPRNPKDRVSLFLKIDESKREAINKKVWQDEWDELRQKQLAKYIRDHAAKLGDLGNPAGSH